MDSYTRVTRYYFSNTINNINATMEDQSVAGRTVVSPQRAERMKRWLEGQDPRDEEKRWLLVVYPDRS